jgi:tetratricopeptide (TPR) repeat protein
MRRGYGLGRLLLCACAMAAASGGGPRAVWAGEPDALARERALAQTYRKMLAEDPYQEYALRRLLEVSHSVGGLPGLLDAVREELAAQPERAASWALRGRLAEAAGRDEEALDAYGRAAALTPKAPEPWLATATLHRRARRAGATLEAYDRAVALAKGKARKQEVLKEAIGAALELKAPDQADGYAAALVATEPNNAYLRMDYAAALAAAGLPERALAAWLQSAQTAGGELKLQVIIWRQVAELQEQLGQLEAAEATWRGALDKVPRGHWAREGYLEGLVGLYRRKDGLRALVEELTPEGRRDPGVRVVVARLLEEIGEDGQALEWFRKVVEERPSDLASRERIIAILERTAGPDAVIDAWRALVRASGGEPRYELRLVEILFQRGRASEAFVALNAMARRYPQDPGVHQSVIDLTMRYGDKQARGRVEREYRTLMKLEPREQGHVISLGEFHWTAGDRARALATWRRLLEMGRTAGEGHLALAEVLADHMLAEEAEAQFKAAVAAQPDDARAAMAYAMWLERQDRAADALALWQKVLETAQRAGESGPGRPADVDEARRRVIGLWERTGRLSGETERLEARFAQQPPDVEAGRSLAESYLRQRRDEDAQRVLEGIVAIAPDDPEALVGLEEIYTRQSRLPEAIAALESLARVNPRSAHEYFLRAADLALTLGDDARALGLARRAVAVNPADPAAHAQVGDLYLRMGRVAEAAEALRQSLTLDPRAYGTRFRLAGLYSDLGQPLREEQVLIDIVRDASDPSDLLRAGRRLLQVASRSGRLDDVEVALRPLFSGQGARHEQVLRLLIEVYANAASEIAWSDAPAAERLQANRRLGERALEPLMAALTGTDVALRARALVVARQTQPRGAVPALARLAVEPDAMTGFQAAVALGHIGTASARDALARMLGRPGPDGADVALWALGLTRDPAAAQWLVPALTTGTPRANILAALALGLTGGDGAVDALIKFSASNQPAQRIAALWSLAHLADPAAVPVLARALRSDEAHFARTAAWGLGRVATPPARQALVDALWDPAATSPGVVAAALLAPEPSPAQAERLVAAYTTLADADHAQLNANAAPLVAELHADAAPEATDAALAARGPAIAARLDAILAAGDGASLALLLDSLASAAPAVALPPLTAPAASSSTQATVLPWLLARAAPLLAVTAPDRAPALRAAALSALGPIAAHAPPPTRAALREAALLALAEPAAPPALRVAALQALAHATRETPDDPAVVAALSAELRPASATPATRLAAARVLAHLDPSATVDLAQALLQDPDASVRLAALAALTAQPAPPAPDLTETVIDRLGDLVPAVRLAALDLLSRSPSPRARAAALAATHSVDVHLRLRARALLQ